ncbi:MAG: polyprenol phosphomannose-dependent alpha 1,6 mannosyltransferase MptB [Solirubrobacterales bacterium]
MSWRRLTGIAALLALLAVAVPLVAPGRDVVQAAGRGGDPAWILGVFGEGLRVSPDAYFDLERVAFVLYVLAVACAAAVPARLLKIAIVVLVAGFTLAPPLLSLDVFSYISYARLEVVHGLNPYLHAPLDAPGDPAFDFIERWRGTVSAYGPVFTILSLPLAKLSLGAALWTAKAAIGASVLALTALVARLAERRGLDPRPAAALVALNPLVLVHVVGGPHNDALMMLAATAGVGAVLAGREAGGGAALAAAAAIKVSAAFVAPFALLGAERRGRFAAGAAVALAAIGLATLAVFGSNPLDSLAIVGENQHRSSHYSVPVTLARDLGIGSGWVRAAALVAYTALVAGLLAWTWRGGDWVRAAGWAGLGLLLATSWLTPWYVIWALPLAAIARDRALVLAAIAFTGYQLLHQVPL